MQQVETNTIQMNKLLNSAISAKQDAMSLQLKYYQKMLEFQNECSLLRKCVCYSSGSVK